MGLAVWLLLHLPWGKAVSNLAVCFTRWPWLTFYSGEELLLQFSLDVQRSCVFSKYRLRCSDIYFYIFVFLYKIGVWEGAGFVFNNRSHVSGFCQFFESFLDFGKIRLISTHCITFSCKIHELWAILKENIVNFTIKLQKINAMRVAFLLIDDNERVHSNLTADQCNKD